MNEQARARPADGAAGTSAKNVYLSSTFVRETATLGGMIVPGAVPPAVEAALAQAVRAETSTDKLGPMALNHPSLARL